MQHKALSTFRYLQYFFFVSFQESSWHQVALLQEMFPAASPAEARHCLAVAGGDIAKAAQLALHRQEAGQSIVSNLTFLTVRNFTVDFSSDFIFNSN